MNKLFEERPSFLGGVYWTDFDEETLETECERAHSHLYLAFQSSPTHQSVSLQNIGNTILEEFGRVSQKPLQKFFARWNGNPVEKIAFWEAIR